MSGRVHLKEMASKPEWEALAKSIEETDDFESVDTPFTIFVLAGLSSRPSHLAMPFAELRPKEKHTGRFYLMGFVYIGRDIKASGNSWGGNPIVYSHALQRGFFPRYGRRYCCCFSQMPHRLYPDDDLRRDVLTLNHNSRRITTMKTYQPSPGFQTIEEEFEARTRKAFTEWDDHGNPPADYVVIDSKRQGFQIAMTEFCQRKGWLDEGELVELDSQSTEYRFRLTAAGKKHFGKKK